MIVTPEIKAKEVLNIASTMFDNVLAIKITAIQIVDEIIDELSHNSKFDWLSVRRTGEETILYWRDVKTQINNLYPYQPSEE